MPDGAFSAAARAAIFGATLNRCAGCGTDWSVNAQHRLPRGMGGTSRALTAEMGVAICGSGTTGCHGWAEANPVHATALGWHLPPGADPWRTPMWTRQWGWVTWTLDTPPGQQPLPQDWLITFTPTPVTPATTAARAAHTRYLQARARKATA